MKDFVNTPTNFLRNMFLSMDSYGKGKILWKEVINYILSQLSSEYTVEKNVCIYYIKKNKHLNFYENYEKI